MHFSFFAPDAAASPSRSSRSQTGRRTTRACASAAADGVGDRGGDHARKAEPRMTRGGQRAYSSLAILTALTLRAVFRLALRQTEGLIGSVIRLLRLDLAVPDHSTLSRRAETLEVPRPSACAGAEPMHLLVDSTGLKLCGAGEWLHEKHGTKVRRSWRKLHLGMDAGTGQIVASLLTTKDVDDGSQVGPLLDQVEGPLASFTGDGAYDQEGVTSSVDRAPSRSGDHRAATRERGAERHGRDRTDTAGPPSPANRQARPLSLAEDVRLHQARQSRDRYGALQAGDRRRPALAHGRAPGNRGRRRCPRPQPHAGVRTPELRPHRLNHDRGWGQRVHLADYATTPQPRRAVVGCGDQPLPVRAKGCVSHNPPMCTGAQ